MTTAPRELDLTDIVVRSISVSDMDNNVYVLTHRRTGAQVLIDAADDAPAIAELLTLAGQDADSPALQWILTTHSHWDHVRALGQLKGSTGAPTACGRDDVPAIDVEMDRLLDDGDLIEVPGFTLEVIHLVGHTPGSVALVLRAADQPAHIFTGDSLFPGGVGKTQNEDDFRSLLNDVQTKIFDRFGDDTVVHPGHGDSTTLGAERPHLDEWAQRGW